MNELLKFLGGWSPQNYFGGGAGGGGAWALELPHSWFRCFIRSSSDAFLNGTLPVVSLPHPSLRTSINLVHFEKSILDDYDILCFWMIGEKRQNIPIGLPIKNVCKFKKNSLPVIHHYFLNLICVYVFVLIFHKESHVRKKAYRT